MTEKETTSEKIDQHTDHYIRIGATLAQARKDAGLSRRVITERLRLPGLVIEDIECGRVDRLSGLYRRGYITNYARLVGLDPAALLAEVTDDELPELREVLPVNAQSWKFERYLKIATYALVTTVIVPPLLYFFIQGGSRIMEREPAPDLADTVVQEPATGTEQGGSRIARTLPLDETGVRQSREGGHVSASAIPLSPRSSRDPEAGMAEGGNPGVLDASPIGPAEAQAVALNRLAIEVTGDSWIEIHDADGQRLEYDLIRAGESRGYEGRAPFRLLLGRANAVNLVLDGQEIEYEGHDRGDLARLELLASGEVLR